MDSSTFDRFARVLAAGVSRRSALGFLAALGGAAVAPDTAGAGKKKKACKGGKKRCGKTCVDLATHPKHCGRCGTGCGPGGICVDGRCAACTTDAQCTGTTDTCRDGFCACGTNPACTGGAVCCGSGCVDVARNPDHCGACGNTCGAGRPCQQGACANHRVVSTFGAVEGSGPEQFDSPRKLVLAGGVLYVADAGNARIQRLTADGAFLGALDGQTGGFASCWDVAVAPDGSIYVLDGANHRVQKLDANGAPLGRFGGRGSGDGELLFPEGGLVVDGDGNVYVADHDNHRVQKFDADGTFVTKWGSLGSGDGQLVGPRALALDGAGHVYVLDGRDRVQKFDRDGGFVASWGESGRQDGQFDLTEGIGVAPDGSIFVSDWGDGNQRIQRFDADGRVLSVWRSREGSGLGQWDVALGLAPVGAGRVYAADFHNSRVLLIEPA